MILRFPPRRLRLTRLWLEQSDGAFFGSWLSSSEATFVLLPVSSEASFVSSLSSSEGYTLVAAGEGGPRLEDLDRDLPRDSG